MLQKLSLHGWTLARINRTINRKVSRNSIAQWKSLFFCTQDAVWDPAVYQDRGRPWVFSSEESKFVLAELMNAKPALYLDKIQSHIEAMMVTHHPMSKISDHLKFWLHLTKKVAKRYTPPSAHGRGQNTPIVLGHNQKNNLFFLVSDCSP